MSGNAGERGTCGVKGRGAALSLCSSEPDLPMIFVGLTAVLISFCSTARIISSNSLARVLGAPGYGAPF